MKNIFDDLPRIANAENRQRNIRWMIIFAMVVICLCMVALVVMGAEKMTATTLKEHLPAFGGFNKIDIIEWVVVF